MSNQNPSISVIIPVYKVEKYIGNTIRSLINQTFRDFEIILVDDGSPDNSSAIAENALKESDIPFRLIKQENKGLGIARNSGFFESRASRILFLDSDDALQPFALSMLFDSSVRHPNAKAIFSDFQYVSEEEIFKESPQNASEELFTRDGMIEKFLKRSINLILPGTLYDSDFLKKQNILQNSLRWSEDQYFMWNLLSRADETVYINAKLYNYLCRSGSIMSATPAESILEAYKAFEDLAEKATDKRMKKYLLSRWVFGCVRSAALRRDRKLWDELCKEMDFRRHLKRLLSFPDLKVRLAALFGLISANALYALMVRGSK